MPRLIDQKEWLTLREAANHLSTVFSEESVTEADILRLALDRKITLSVKLVNSVLAQPVNIVSRGQARVDVFRVYDDRPLEPEFIARDIERSKLLDMGDEIEQGINDGSIDIEIVGKRFGDKVIEFGEVTSISGVSDLPMLGDESLVVEAAWHASTDKAQVTHPRLWGVFVKDEDSNVYQLIYNANAIGGFDDYLSRSEEDREPDYYPLEDLPDSSSFVVRVQALRKFEADLSIEKEPIEKSWHYQSDELALMNRAAKKFWANADLDNDETFPTNKEVSAWLVENGAKERGKKGGKASGFTKTLADKAATLIRPNKAKVGRRSEK